MEDTHEFKLKKISTLKFSRLKSMRDLKTNLNSFEYKYSMSEAKVLFDLLLSGNFKETFNRKFKYCFDSIFDDNEYEELNEEYIVEQNFPDNWIPPIG